MARDVKKIASAVDIVTVINDIVPLKKQGSKFVGICPFHDDHKSSLTVSRPKQRFKCFACGKGGDVVDFFMGMGNTFHEAVDKIEFKRDIKISPTPVKVSKPRPQWRQITHPDYYPKKIVHYEYGQPSMVWGYYNPDCTPMGYVCRFDTAGGKQIAPYVFATNGKRKSWWWLGFNKPRPLYNLPQLIKDKDGSVIVVEGEKAADAAKKLFPKYIVVSWQGGAEAVKYTDFSPLNGRSVLYIPDNDLPGFRAMIAISEIVQNSKALFVDTSDMPLHWDIADEPHWTTKDAVAFVRDYVTDKLMIKKEYNEHNNTR